MLNHFCTSLDFTLNLMVYYGILQQNDAQCFALEASITAGAYLLVPITLCMSLLNTFVVKAYVQELREKAEGKELVSEDENLRAFDRTTWDNRADAVEAIRPADVLFTDTFRWALTSQSSGSFDTLNAAGIDPRKNKLTDIDSHPLLAGITATSSDEEFGSDLQAALSAEVSVGILGGEDYSDAPESTATNSDNMSVTTK